MRAVTDLVSAVILHAIGSRPQNVEILPGARFRVHTSALRASVDQTLQIQAAFVGKFFLSL